MPLNLIEALKAKINYQDVAVTCSSCQHFAELEGSSEVGICNVANVVDIDVKRSGRCNEHLPINTL